MPTGVTAFRLSMGKALVPLMFMYAPSLLFLDFSWVEFSVAMFSGVLCIVALSAAYIGYFAAPIRRWEVYLLTVLGLTLVGNNPWVVAVCSALVIGLLARNRLKMNEEGQPSTAAG